MSRDTRRSVLPRVPTTRKVGLCPVIRWHRPQWTRLAAAGPRGLLDKGFDATYLHLDIVDPDSRVAARDLVETRHGRLDVLVNNAGIIHVTEIAEEALAALNHRPAVNLTGAFLRARARRREHPAGGGRVCSGPRRSARI